MMDREDVFAMIMSIVSLAISVAVLVSKLIGK